jgi:hypothetical protein
VTLPSAGHFDVGKASRLTSSIAGIALHLPWPEGKAGRLTYPKGQASSAWYGAPGVTVIR